MENQAIEGIRVHRLPQLPRRLYVEGPSLGEVQRLMTYSQLTYHGRGIRVIDNVDRKWLQGDIIPLILPPATWVKITDRGLYKNDLALVVESPSQGDVVTLAVVPRFSQNSKKTKRRGTKPDPVRLDPESLAQLPFKENFHRSGLRRFHPNGLEFLLAPAAHTLYIENNPPEEELRPFEEAISLQFRHDIDRLILDAVKSAYHRKVREMWRVGDRMRICDGEFIGCRCHLVEVDSSSQSALVSVLAPDSSKPIHVHIDLAHLVQYFEIGDVVRVVIGMEKGRKGSITSIEEEVATIVELSSEPGEFFVEVIIFSHFLPLWLIIYSQFESNLGYLESYVPDPVSLQTHVSLVPALQTTMHQETALEGIDSRMGQYATVLAGSMRGRQGRLIHLTNKSATIECIGDIGRGNEKITGLLRDFALL